MTKFDKLPKKDKVLAIVHDILEQIKIGRYEATIKSYINIKDIYDDTEDIKENFEKISNCTVCAIGSIILSCTHLNNKLTFKDISTGAKGLVEADKKLKFSNIFGSKQLLLIETAFEGYDLYLEDEEDFSYYQEDDRYAHIAFQETLSYLEAKSCNNFYIKYDDEERLIAICKNIIKNDGIFIP